MQTTEPSKIKKEDFLDLNCHLGVIKRRYSPADPFIYGFIVAVPEVELLSSDHFILFRPEGETCLKKIRIAAFEQSSRVAKDLQKIADDGMENIVSNEKKAIPKGKPLHDSLPKPSRTERVRAARDRLIGFINNLDRKKRKGLFQQERPAKFI